MRKKMALLICATVVMSSVEVEAITNGGRLKSILASFAIVAGLTYSLQKLDQAFTLQKLDQAFTLPYQVDNAFPYFKFKDAERGRGRIASFFGAGAALVTLLALSSYMPNYRYEWAMKERNALNNNVLFKYLITRENITKIKKAAGAESSPLPLVFLFLSLSYMNTKVTELISQLEIALKDAGDSSALGIQITSLLDQLHEDRLRVRESLHVVKNVDPAGWAKQWEIHNGNIMKEKEIAAMQQVANRPHLHFGGNLNYHGHHY